MGKKPKEEPSLLEQQITKIIKKSSRKNAKEPDARTLAEIISDTRSGVPLADDQGTSRKKALIEVRAQAEVPDKVEDTQFFQPQTGVQLVNGQIVIMHKAAQKIDECQIKKDR
jgi:hypothetical protein